MLLPLQVKGSDYMVLDSYCKFVTTTAKFLDIDIGQKYISITIYISLGARPSVCEGLALRLAITQFHGQTLGRFSKSGSGS